MGDSRPLHLPVRYLLGQRAYWQSCGAIGCTPAEPPAACDGPAPPAAPCVLSVGETLGGASPDMLPPGCAGSTAPALAALPGGSVPDLMPGCSPRTGVDAGEAALCLCIAAARISAAFVKLKLDATAAPPVEVVLGACMHAVVIGYGNICNSQW